MPNACFQGERPLLMAAWAFPVVGAAIGGAGGALYWLLLDTTLPAIISATITISFLIMLTGALHEDGLADSADAFFVHGDKERRLEIMKDSRIGTYGMLALLCVTLLRITCLGQLSAMDALIWLIVAGITSRAALLFPALALPLAREDGTAGKAGKPDKVGFGIAHLIMLVALFFLAPASLGYALLVYIAVNVLLLMLIRKKLGGYTGDTLGLSAQIMEASMLLLAAALFS